MGSRLSKKRVFFLFFIALNASTKIHEQVYFNTAWKCSRPYLILIICGIGLMGFQIPVATQASVHQRQFYLGKCVHFWCSF
jgi:hypothetical protein